GQLLGYEQLLNTKPKLTCLRLNTQTPCPPRGAVPVNQGRCRRFFHSQHLELRCLSRLAHFPILSRSKHGGSRDIWPELHLQTFRVIADTGVATKRHHHLRLQQRG